MMRALLPCPPGLGGDEDAGAGAAAHVPRYEAGEFDEKGVESAGELPPEEPLALDVDGWKFVAGPGVSEIVLFDKARSLNSMWRIVSPRGTLSDVGTMTPGCTKIDIGIASGCSMSSMIDTGTMTSGGDIGLESDARATSSGSSYTDACVAELRAKVEEAEEARRRETESYTMLLARYKEALRHGRPPGQLHKGLADRVYDYVLMPARLGRPVRWRKVMDDLERLADELLDFWTELGAMGADSTGAIIWIKDPEEKRDARRVLKVIWDDPVEEELDAESDRAS